MGKKGAHIRIKLVSMLLLAGASILSFPVSSSALGKASVQLSADPVMEALEGSVGASSVGQTQFTEADADGDGIITAGDAALLLRYAYGLIPVLPFSSGESALPTLAQSGAATKKILLREMRPVLQDCMDSFSDKALTNYGALAEQAAVFRQTASRLREAVNQGVNSCMPLLSRDLRALGVPLYPSAEPASFPDWKLLAALYRAYGADMPKAMDGLLEVGWNGNLGSGEQLAVSFGALDTLYDAGTREQLMNAKFALAYFNTVYDENGKLRPETTGRLEDAYVKKLIHPVPECLIKNCWMDPRDRGTRLHMGTDIRARSRTPILSMTDGIVLYVGYMSIPGNYVVVRDPDGYEYHYYHMVEKSKQVQEGDEVKRGETIGLVGNTGNSAASHLHLAIISPEQVYLNPYDVFLQAGIEPIRIDG